MKSNKHQTAIDNGMWISNDVSMRSNLPNVDEWDRSVQSKRMNMLMSLDCKANLYTIVLSCMYLVCICYVFLLYPLCISYGSLMLFVPRSRTNMVSESISNAYSHTFAGKSIEPELNAFFIIREYAHWIAPEGNKRWYHLFYNWMCIKDKNVCIFCSIYTKVSFREPQWCSRHLKQYRI
jgi:hypothetical protein